MKKLLAILLLVSMLVTLAACGDGKKDFIVSEPQSASGSQGGSTPQSPAGGINADDVMGAYSASTNTYTNNFIGIGCKLNADWEVFSAEQIAQLNGLMNTMITDQDLADLLKNSGTVQPFYAQAEDGLVTLNITLEDLGARYGSTLSEQQYANMAAGQLAPVLESIGLTGIDTQIGSLSFAGSDHVAVFVSGSLQGTAFYETLVCVKVGNHIAIVTAGSYLSDKTRDSLSLFYGL